MGGSQHQRSFPRRVVEMAPILSDYCRVVCALTYSSGTEENFIILRRFEGAGEPAKSINQRPTKHYRHGVCHVIDLEQLFVKVCLQPPDASKSSADALNGVGAQAITQENKIFSAAGTITSVARRRASLVLLPRATHLRIARGNL